MKANVLEAVRDVREYLTERKTKTATMTTNSPLKIAAFRHYADRATGETPALYQRPSWAADHQ